MFPSFSSTDQHVVFYFDVGDIVSGKVDPRTPQSHEKIKYLKNHFTPPPSYTGFFSKTVVKGKDKRTTKLVFQPSWLEKYTWLVYSLSQVGGFRKYCVMHNNPSDPRAQKRPLVTAPFQKLKKATGKNGALERHQKMQCHQLALEAGIAIIRSFQKPKETLPYRISTQNQEMFEKNMNALRVIITTIIMCGKQNIPLRGHRDDSTSTASNKGNFHAILMLLGNSDKNLQEHLLTGRRNVTSTSKTVQKEVIRITGDYIRAKVTQPIQKEDAFFSIIGDEVTEMSSGKSKTFGFIFTFFVTKNSLGTLKPIAAKLQKKEQDVFQAYSMIDDTIKAVARVRSNIEEECHEWF